MGAMSVFEYCIAFYKHKLDCISEAQSKLLNYYLHCYLEIQKKKKPKNFCPHGYKE